MEQLDRAERYLTRLHYAYEGIQEPSAIFSIENPKDDCISFFMHCYHVKDWLKAIYCNSQNERQAVERFVNDNKELQICADICNGAKHLKLTSELRSGVSQKVEIANLNSSLWLTGTGGIEVHRCKFTVTSEHETHDALQLAVRCMELWRNYVKSVNA